MPRGWQGLEWGMAAGILSRPVTKPLSLGAAAMLSVLVRREYSYRAYQLSGGLCTLGPGASSLVTKWINDRGLFPNLPRLRGP